MCAAVIPSLVEGVHLRLRSVQAEDAAYIHGLRTDPLYNRHLSPVFGTVGVQRAWIKGYRTREAALREVYYIIERRDNGRSCGTVRLYDIDPACFTWGSWILDANKPPKAALESAVLSFGVGFLDFGCELAKVNVRIGNTHAEAFYRRLGMTETHRTAQDIYFEYPRSRFDADRAKYEAILTGEVGA
jgi:RimJ/RimL family protein N-acetyltransferase